MKGLAFKSNKLSSSPEPTAEGEHCLLKVVLCPSHAFTNVSAHTDINTLKRKKPQAPAGWNLNQTGRGKNPKDKQDNKKIYTNRLR